MTSGAARPTSPRFIARRAELAQLQTAAAQAQAGSGQSVLLAGPAGSGKTRLLAELARDWPGPVLRVQCHEDDQTSPRAALQIGLAALLGARSPLAAPPDAGSDAAAQRALFESSAKALFTLATSQPLLALFEDLQWGDEATLTFVRFLARRLTGRRVLLIGTYRPEEGPAALTALLASLEREALAPVLTLPPLTPGEVAALLAELVGARTGDGARTHPLPPALAAEIAAASEGNPRYVEELVAALIEAGDLVAVEGGWALAEGRAVWTLRVPPRLSDALRSQAANLSPDASRVLDVAGVIGRAFDYAVLAAVTGLLDAALLPALRALADAGLIRETAEDAFAFRQPLLREAAQARLLSRERRVLHGQVAEALAKLAKEGAAAHAEAHAAELAYHYYEAGAWREALAHARTAAEAARRLDAPADALRHLTAGLDAAAHLGQPPPLDLLLLRAEMHERTGDFEAASADLEAARAEAERSGRTREAWAALLKLGALWAARDYRRTLDYLDAALAVAETLDDPLARAESLNRIGNVYLNRDQPDAALPYHHAALDAFRAAGDAPGQAATYEMLAVCYYNLPDVLAGAACEERAFALGRASGDRQAVFHASIHLLLPLRFETEVGPQGDPERLVRLGEDALAAARQMGWAGGEAQALGLLGGFLALLGQYDRALPLLAEAVAFAERLGYGPGISAGERIMGEVLLDLLQFDAAAARLRRSRSEAEAAGSGLFAAVATLALCRVLAARRAPGDLDEAQTLLDELLAGGALPGGRTQREAAWVAAELALSRGDADGALAGVTEVIAGTCHLPEAGLGAVPRLALLQGRALAALGRTDEAVAALEAAVAGAAALDRRPLLWQAHASLGRVLLDLRQRRAATEHFAQARSLIEAEANAIPDRAPADPVLADRFRSQALALLPPRPAPTERRRAKEQHAGLTEREREVVRLVAAGDANREIGEKLVISERTAERHVANILAKLGLHSRVQLAGWAADNDLL